MPAKNRIKTYEAGAYYHIYNRGVAKRPVFVDDQDFGVFLSYCKTYLLPKDSTALQDILASDASSKEKDKALKLLRMNNFADTVKLLAYCLMSNHFHMLVYQKEAENIDQFMNSLGTRYAMYFNKKYKRVGPLFQGVYKAVRITSEEQLLHLTKYIHRNPDPDNGKVFQTYPYSSYVVYRGLSHASWIESGSVLGILSKKNQYKKYQEFVEERRDFEEMAATLKDLVVDL